MKLDNRGLEPPQPMMRTLAALEELKSGDTLIIWNDRRPMFLYEQLDELGYHYETTELSTGGFQIEITK